MLVALCVLYSTIHGRIDQVNQILDLDKEEQGGARFVVFQFLCNLPVTF